MKHLQSETHALSAVGIACSCRGTAERAERALLLGTRRKTQEEKQKKKHEETRRFSALRKRRREAACVCFDSALRAMSERTYRLVKVVCVSAPEIGGKGWLGRRERE
eukprot:977951-Rhodomonas_salina.1